jgi:hypothetical protein
MQLVDGVLEILHTCGDGL